MARKLKTYQTLLGSFDRGIAAPLTKAALEASDADSNLFHLDAEGQPNIDENSGNRWNEFLVLGFSKPL